MIIIVYAMRILTTVINLFMLSIVSKLS